MSSSTDIEQTVGRNTDFGLPVLGPVQPREQCEKRWQQYTDAWSAFSASDRERLIHASLSPDIVYATKLAQLSGHKALINFMEEFQQKVPGAKFVNNALNLHNSYGQSEYAMVDATGKQVMEGSDYCEWAEDGRVSKVVSYFDIEADDSL